MSAECKSEEKKLEWSVDGDGLRSSSAWEAVQKLDHCSRSGVLARVIGALESRAGTGHELTAEDVLLLIQDRAEAERGES